MTAITSTIIHPDKPRIIVTGGAGYIGSHTCIELAAAGFVPVIVDNFSNSHHSVCNRIDALCGFKVPVYELDCCDAEAMQVVFDTEPNIAGAIHFAAFKSVSESIKNPDAYYRNNLGSLDNLTQVMQHAGVTNLVFSSSCTVYGEDAQMPVTESTPFGEASSPYGHTKQLCEERLTQSVSDGQPLRCALLRYFNPVGAHPSGMLGEQPTGKAENLMPILMERIRLGGDPLRVFGSDYNTPDGSCIRDFIHVCDLAQAHVRALRFLAARQEPHMVETFNIGTGTGTTVLQLIRTFATVNGIPVPHVIDGRREGDIPVMYADANKALRLLGWKAKYSLDVALFDAWRWWMRLKPAAAPVA